jgi:O-antigen/teichoic acid export membrane protein
MTIRESGHSGETVTFLGEFSKKLATNTFFNVLGRFWSFFVTILLTPYILHRLGERNYGIWAAFTVFIGSSNLLDLGLGSSILKFISEYHAQKDFEKINKAIFSGIIFYGLFGFALIGAGLMFRLPLLEFFRISDASNAYVMALFACAIQSIGAMVLGVFKGIQRMDKSNSIEMRMLGISALGAVVLLWLGYGLTGLTLNTLIWSAVSLVVSWIAVRRAVPKISLGFHFDGGVLREMFSYGAKIQISQFGALVGFQSPKFIILRFLGPVAVSAYDLSSRLASYMRAIPLMMISALIPATSELGARNDRPRILKAYLLASKYVSMVTVAITAFTVLEAESLIRLWLGNGHDSLVLLLQVLAIGYGANILGGAASQTGAGVGRPEFDMRSALALAVLSPILAISLVPRFGVTGVGVGTSLALIIAAGYLLVTFHRNYVETPFGSTFREIYARPIVAGILANFAVSGFHSVVLGMFDMDRIQYFSVGHNMARLVILAKIIVDAAVFSPVYFVLLVALRQVTATDWKNFVGLTAFGSELLRHPFRERVKIYR